MLPRAKSHLRKLVSKPHDEGGEYSPWSPRFRSRVNIFGFVLFICVATVLLLVPHREITAFTFFHVQFEYIYSGLCMVLIFGWIYGINVKLWKRVGIPWCYTLEISPGHAASTAHVWSMCTVLTAILATCVTATVISLQYEWSRGLFPACIFPLTAFFGFAAFLFVPAHVLYNHTRMFLLKALYDTMISPFFSVFFLHNFLADILTSLPLAIYRIEYAICFLVSGDFLEASPIVPIVSRCGADSLHASIMTPTLYALPFLIRFLQCLSRRREEKRKGSTGWAVTQHSVNAGKYASALGVVITSSLAGFVGTKDLTRADFFSYLWFTALVIKSFYCVMWDMTMDWGLLKRQYGYLRKDLIFARPLYYFAIVTNFMGRCAFALTISPKQCPENWKVFLAFIEILRRGQWNVFRLEKEYLVLSPEEKEVAFDFSQPLDLTIPPFMGSSISDSLLAPAGHRHEPESYAVYHTHFSTVYGGDYGTMGASRDGYSVLDDGSGHRERLKTDLAAVRMAVPAAIDTPPRNPRGPGPGDDAGSGTSLLSQSRRHSGGALAPGLASNEDSGPPVGSSGERGSAGGAPAAMPHPPSARLMPDRSVTFAHASARSARLPRR